MASMIQRPVIWVANKIVMCSTLQVEPWWSKFDVDRRHGRVCLVWPNFPCFCHDEWFCGQGMAMEESNFCSTHQLESDNSDWQDWQMHGHECSKAQASIQGMRAGFGSEWAKGDQIPSHQKEKVLGDVSSTPKIQMCHFACCPPVMLRRDECTHQRRIPWSECMTLVPLTAKKPLQWGSKTLQLMCLATGAFLLCHFCRATPLWCEHEVQEQAKKDQNLAKQILTKMLCCLWESM